MSHDRLFAEEFGVEVFVEFFSVVLVVFVLVGIVRISAQRLRLIGISLIGFGIVLCRRMRFRSHKVTIALHCLVACSLVASGFSVVSLHFLCLVVVLVIVVLLAVGIAVVAMRVALAWITFVRPAAVRPIVGVAFEGPMASEKGAVHGFTVGARKTRRKAKVLPGDIDLVVRADKGFPASGLIGGEPDSVVAFHDFGLCGTQSENRFDCLVRHAE